MTGYRMRVLGYNDAEAGAVAAADPNPVYVQAYDVNAHGGQGAIEFTTDPAKALTWIDVPALWGAWQTVSTVRPFRPDGQPNRPLTACTIEAEPIRTEADAQ